MEKQILLARGLNQLMLLLHWIEIKFLSNVSFLGALIKFARVLYLCTNPEKSG